jgi:hypothetical protein
MVPLAFVCASLILASFSVVLLAAVVTVGAGMLLADSDSSGVTLQLKMPPVALLPTTDETA